MGVLGQLGALFWKNILIRVRHPTYIVLEVVWPVILFVVLVLMRLGSPPDHRETCEYQSRDLPSAGLMPFIQSSVCTLNNNCSSKSWVEDRAAAQQRFQALINDINPVIQKDTTLEAFKALPTVTKVLTNIKEVAGTDAIKDLDKKLVLRNMFRDPDQVVTILSDRYNILDRRVASALLDAAINPVAFVTSIGTVDFKEVVCDPNELERFIILSDHNNKYIVNKFKISNSLCRVPDELISNITNEIVHQLDVANIVRLGKDLANITGDVDIAELMADMANLLDMYLDSSSLLSMIDMMPDLMFIPQVFRDIGRLIPLVSDMSTIDLEQMSSLLEFVRPTLTSLVGDDDKMAESIENMITGVQQVIDSLDFNRPPKITTQLSYTDVYFAPGETLVLPCYAEGSPAPRYIWHRNGVEYKPSGEDVTSGRVLQLSESGTLAFYRPESKDEGIYQCFADNGYGVAASMKYSVIEAKLHQFAIEATKTHRIEVGQPLTLPCAQPLSIPASDVYWVTKAENGIWDPINFDDRISMDIEGRLRFANVKKTDEMQGKTYVCLVVNNLLRRTSIGPDNVIQVIGTMEQYYPVQLMYVVPRVQYFIKGRNFRLQCIFSGNPTPEVTWEKLNGSMSDRVLIEGQMLHIPDPELSDAGQYACHGINSETPQRVTITFDITGKAAPEWVEKPHSVEAIPGDTAVFKCRASGNPDVVYEWYINGVKLEDVKDPRIYRNIRFNQPDMNTLVLFDVTVEDQMNFQCNASNMYGYVFADVTLNVAGQGNVDAIIKEIPTLMNELSLLDSAEFNAALSAGGAPVAAVSDMITMMMKGENWLDAMLTSMDDTLDYVEYMIRDMYGNQSTDLMMAMATNAMEMMQEYTTYADNLQADLKDVASKDAVVESLNLLNDMGSNVTYQFLTEMVTMENFYSMMVGNSSAMDICSEAIKTTYKIMSRSNAEAAMSSVCTPEATDAIDEVFVYSGYFEMTGKLTEHMTEMDTMMSSGTIPPTQSMMELKVMFETMMDMVGDTMANMETNVTQWMTILDKTDIEVPETDYYWQNINERFNIHARLLLPLIAIGEASENSPMWSSVFSPYVEMVDAVVHYVARRIQKVEEMNKENKIITHILQYLPYYPEIIKSAFGANISQLIEELMRNNSDTFTDMICQETEWDKINMVNGDSVDELKHFICTTNVTQLFWDLFDIMDPMSLVAGIEKEFNNNLDMPIDWLRMAENIQYVVSTLVGENSFLDIFSSVQLGDFSWISSYYTVVYDSLTAMTTEGAASSEGQALDESFKSLDQALESWDLWKRVKHYARTWNLLAKLFNKYGPMINDPNWNVTSYLTDMSPTLGGFLSETTETMPEVIRALEDTAQKPDMLGNRLSGLDFMNFCGDEKSLSLVLGIQNTPDLIQLQNDLCSLDWEQIQEELKQNDEQLGQFMDQWEMIMTYDTESLPPIMLNWTDIVETTTKFVENIESGMFDNFVPELSNFGLTQVDSSITDLATALESTWNFDVEKIAGSVGQLMDLLYDMEDAENDTFISYWKYNIAANSYLNYYVYKFVNIHLGIINETKTFNLSAHLNSSEAVKFLELLEQTPELNEVLLSNILSITNGLPDGWLSVNIETLCNDTAQFESLLKMPANTTLTRKEVVDAVCRVVDFDALINELRYGMEGLDDVITAVEQITSNHQAPLDNLVDYKMLAPVLQQYMDLIDDLAVSTITTVGLPLSRDGDLDKLQQQFESFLEDLENNMSTIDPVDFLQFNNSQSLESLNQLQEIPMVSEILQVTKTYMTAIRSMISESSDMLTQPDVGFAKYPEMYKMWQLMDMLPHLYAVFTYTSMVDNAKISKFVDAATRGPDGICAESPYTLMTDPPIMNIRFEDIFNQFCSIDFTELGKEASMFIQAENISDTYDNLSNGTRVNIQEWITEYNNMVADWDNMIGNADNFIVPGFDNMTLWTDIMEFLNTVSTTYDPMQLVSLNQQQTLQNLESLLEIPGMSGWIHVSETYMMVMTAMLDKSSEMFTDPAVGFRDYPEMYKVWNFMDWLPQLYTIFSYTSYVDNTKITRFFEALLQGPEHLCGINSTLLMTDPPIMDIQFAPILRDFCTINLTALEDEIDKFIQAEQIREAYDALRSNSTNGTTSMETWLSVNNQLSTAIERFINQSSEFKWPDFYNETLWLELLDFLGQIVMNDSNIMNVVAGGNSNLMEVLASVSPEFEWQMKITDISYDLMEMMLDRLENLTDGGANLADIFYGYAEIQKLMLLIQEPHVVEMVAYSLNTPQFSELLSRDADMVVDDLCNNNFSKYFTVPPEVSLNLTRVQEKFCAIDIDVLMTQFSDFAMVEQIIDKMSDNYTISWRTLEERNRDISARIERLITDPPMIDLPVDWTNETFWIELMSLLNGPQATGAGDPSMEAFLKQLETFIGNEYSSLVETWAPVALAVTSAVDMNMEAKRAFATVDLVLDFLNERMQDVGDDFSIEDLAKNSTDIVRFMEALSELRNVLTTSGDYNETVDSIKLSELLVDTEMLQDKCDNGTVSEYIAINGTVSSITDAMAEIVCFDPDTWNQVLQDQVDLERFEEMLMDIWNSSNTDLKLNWTSVANNIETFVNIFISWIESPPNANSELMKWASWEGIQDGLDYLLSDPYMFTNILQSIYPTLGISDEVTMSFNKLLMPFINKLQSENLEELFADPEKLMETFSTLINVNDWLSVVSGVYQAAWNESQPTRQEVLEDFVCWRSDDYLEYIDYLMRQNLSITILCGRDYGDWHMIMTEWYRWSSEEVSTVYSVFDAVVELARKRHREAADTMEVVTSVIEGLKLDLFIDGAFWVDWLESVAQANIGNDDYMGLLSLMDDDRMIREFKSTLLVIVEIQNKLNGILDNLTGNHSVPLTDILPDADSVANLVADFANSGSFSTLLMSSVDPAKFLMLMLSDNWNETVCNLTLFEETFQFRDDIDVASVQADICSNIDTQQYYLTEISKSVDLGDLLERIEDIIDTEGANASSDTWVYMLNMFDVMIQKMVHLDKVDTFGIDNWSGRLLETLGSLMNSTADTSANLKDTCHQVFDNLPDTSMVQEYIDPVDSFIKISNSVMNILINMNTAVCDMNSNDTKEILDELTRLGVPSELAKVSRMLSGENNGFSCDSVSLYTDFVETLTSSLSNAFEGNSNIEQCAMSALENAEDLLMDLSQLFTTGSEIAEILDNKDIQDMLSQLLGSNVSTSLLNDVVDIYNQQEKAVASLMKALEKNMTEITSTLQDLVASGTESVLASLNITYLKDAVNLTADELIKQLCDVDISTLDADLNNTLCGNDQKLAREVANTLLNYGTTLSDLENMAEYNSTSFWNKVLSDVSALVGNIEGLTNLVSLVDQLGTVDITNLKEDKEVLKLVQQILVDNGPDAFLNNLNSLISTFSLIDNENVTNSLLKDINMLADGIFAFSALRHYVLTNVKISDLIKDTDYLRNYMINELNFEEDVADAILDSSISLEMLISAAQVNITDWVCNSTQLAEVLKFDNSSVTNAEEISRAFCDIDVDTMSSLLEELITELDIGEFVEDVIMSSDKLFNISMEDTKTAIKSLVTANEDLLIMTDKLNDFADTVPEAFANLAGAQTGQQEFGSFSAILCGSQIPMIKDEFNTESVISRSSDLSEAQRRELASLPGKACKDMYMKIMEDKNGPIIWAYLKPLMRGKILYTPNTPVVDTIIQKINTSFASLEEFVDLALSWAEGSVALTELSGDTAKDIQEILESNLIQGIITEMGGVSANSLDDILYTLETTDINMMKGISKIADMIQSYISCVLLDRFEGYDDESALEKHAAKMAENNELLAGLVFEAPDSNNGRKKRDAHSPDLPHHIHYTIRMDIDNVPITNRIKRRMWRPQPYDQFFTEMRYFRGFIQLQDMVDQAIISLHGNISLSPATTQQMPFPCHTYDFFVNTIAGYLLNVIMTLSWLAGICVAVYNLVYDRERGQEETLCAMGMKSGLNWIAWFFTTMFIMAIVAIIDVLLLHYGNIFIKSNMAITYLYFLDFIFSTIMLCYFTSAFFTRTSLAILASVIVYVLSYLPFVVLYSLEIDMKFWHKTLACLSSTTAFSYAAQYIARYEEQGVGLHWHNIRSDPVNEDGFSFSWCCIMIAIDAVIYFILGWYVRNIKPGKFGVAEPWYFIVCPSYWCGVCTGNKDKYAAPDDDIFVESVNNPSPVVISTRGLSKTYSDGTQAVKNLNIDIHAGNVTTILGHNGAAKTTTMNMMIGVLEPTKGNIMISNQPLKSMKGCLGICSQHNALYDYMTVEEHMKLYSSIKGSYHGNSAKEEIRRLLKEVELWSYRDMLVKNLSGGMQRRLCVALAFVGGSRAVILDEPTSGVDPSGRRAIWNLIIQRKSDSAVLLSTHHLDEADIISDQIAIMHEGRMLCQGSPMFLKHHLACGHRLTIVKRDIETDTTPILSVIRKWIPGVTLQQSAGTELTFVLPVVGESDFYGLFKDLESQSSELNIVSYGISDPKLEEVFMKVCSAAETGVKISPESLRQLDDKMAADNDINEAKLNIDSAGTTDNMKVQKHSGSSSNFTAMLMKRFHHYRRDWRIVLSVLILPLLLVLLASGLYQVRPSIDDYPKIYLSPAMYGPDAYVFVQQESSLDLGEAIKKSFMVKPGIGTSCMKGMSLRSPYKCVEPDSGFSPVNTSISPSGKCDCFDNEYKCEGNPYGAPPPEMVTTTTDILQDLHGRDTVSYLLNSYPEYLHNRFGGWSLSDVRENSEQKLKSKVWYNNQGYHALPAFMNAYSNGLLRAVVNESAETYGISTYSHPFVFSEEPLSADTIVKHAADMGIAVIILLAFTFIPVGVLMYSVNENINKEKHMQFVNGVTATGYWFAALFWDLLVLGVAIGVSVLILLIFKPGSFWDRDNLGATVCLLALYGWSTITLVYLTVKRFSTVGAAFFTMFCTLMFIGILTVLLVFSFNFFAHTDNNRSMEKVYDALRYVFLIFPPYALGGGLLSLIDNHVKTVIYARFNTDVYQDPYSFDMVGWNMFAMGIEGLIFFLMTIWMDIKFCCSREYRTHVDETDDDDSDVILEKKRIDHGDCKQDVVIVRNLHKIYHSKMNEIHAVNGLSFGVPRGQCFGLLGINGAGKSTTFNILTGVLGPSSGSAYILDKRIEQGTSTIHDELGYCPQDDALDQYLSIENTLTFHVKLRDLSPDARKRAVEKVMNKLDLHGIKNKLVKSCSGGMKRRLSLAIALLGDPAVVLLDEPTSGMDPKAKRLVWNCLLEAKQNGQAIILTSHSLEECDVLCDRIGIMVNGQFKCLGSSQHLKQKYGDGYTVMLYMGSIPPKDHNINDLIHTHFPRAAVTEQHVNVVQLDIPKDSIRIADIFSILEQEKGDYNIVYYTVSQTTLDTIFLNFAREQTDGDAVTTQDTDTESDSTPSGSVSNPYYRYVNPAMLEPGDKEKARPASSAYSTPYILPAKNTFVESDQESYSTRL